MGSVCTLFRLSAYEVFVKNDNRMDAYLVSTDGLKQGSGVEGRTVKTA